MGLTELILLAVALGIDCLVVSFSQGLIFNANRTKNSLALAFTMGLFQGGMPVIGFFAAGLVSRYVQAFSDWIVFIIFLILGIKFIYEAFRKEEGPGISCIGFKCLISLGVATSIDALGAGVSLKFAGADLVLSSCLIGVASFFMSLAGFWSGNCFKVIPSKYLEALGGVILIGLALKAVLL